MIPSRASAVCGCLTALAVGAPASPPLAADDVDAPAHTRSFAPEALLWREGRVVARMGADEARAEGWLLIDVSDGWAPYLFSGEAAGRSPGPPHHYAARFTSLARGDYPDDAEGRRARQERYLEPYGIPPTLTVLRAEMDRLHGKPCVDGIDFGALGRLAELEWDEGNAQPTNLKLDPTIDALVQGLLARQGVRQVEHLRPARLHPRELRAVEAFVEHAHLMQAVRALRFRLECEGHLRGVARNGTGLDDGLRAALAEFERRHRIYGQATLSTATLRALQTEPLELTRRAVLRVLTERAMLTAGMIEDGSVTEPDVRNLEEETRERIARSFGLRSPDATRRWLNQLDDLSANGPRWVGLEPPPRPPYYALDMDLYVELDRGDVSYDFPFDERGRPVPNRVVQRPVLTLFVRHAGRSIPLVRYPTTIGGWRILRQEGRDWWVYKESPVGPRVWREIGSAPVWLPPASVPASSLITEVRRAEDGHYERALNENIVGPGYASAYGLVAAYHRYAHKARDGSLRVGGDEGIRTHGTVDYTSVWRRASLGCHRLHNHRAVRLFSFLLAHRPHRRLGHRPASYRAAVEHDGFRDVIRIDETGYIFELDPPLPAEVLPGRVVGQRTTPPEERIPFEPQAAADTK